MLLQPPLLSYYGDDFTGSTDVMEALSLAGVPAVLFVRRPEAAQLERFAEARAVGIAGTSRSQTPAWMDDNLPAVFAWLKGLGAAVCHYKVCSTFDSAPEVGSIGRALDIGQRVFAQPVTPIVVGVPQLKRYTVFGNHYAAMGDTVYRLDRHPVMSRHPVTPMAEADLRRHLAAQTDRTIDLADLRCLARADADAEIDRLMATSGHALLFDVVDEATQGAVGRHLWRHRRGEGLFTVGSSGVEYALLAEWGRLGLVPGRAAFDHPGRAERIAVVSGSVSEVTARQIGWARQNGFADLRLDPIRLVAPDTAGAEMEAAVARADTALSDGRSVILATAEGPATDRGGDGRLGPQSRQEIGRQLGRILRTLVARNRLSRVVVAGGDTASHALGELGIFALTTRLPLPETPGSPLCLAHSDEPALDGLEIALKGGQIGRDSYFGTIRAGAA